MGKVVICIHGKSGNVHDCGNRTDYGNDGQVNPIDVYHNDNSGKYMAMTMVIMVGLMNSMTKNMPRFSDNNSTKEFITSITFI